MPSRNHRWGKFWLGRRREVFRPSIWETRMQSWSTSCARRIQRRTFPGLKIKVWGFGMGELRFRQSLLMDRLKPRTVFGPSGIELKIPNFQVFHHVGVFEKKVVARAGLEEFLLNGQP